MPFPENIPLQEYVQHQAQARFTSLLNDAIELFPEAPKEMILAELSLQAIYLTYQITALMSGNRKEAEFLFRTLVHKLLECNHDELYERGERARSEAPRGEAP